MAQDFGKRLGVGAHLAELRRTRVGNFQVRQARSLEQLQTHLDEGSLGSILTPPDEALARFPYVDLSGDDVRRVRNGLSVKFSQAVWSDGERVRMRDEKRNLIAVAGFNAAEGLLHPSVVIAPENS